MRSRRWALLAIALSPVLYSHAAQLSAAEGEKIRALKKAQLKAIAAAASSRA